MLCIDAACGWSMTNLCFECTHSHNASLEPRQPMLNPSAISLPSELPFQTNCRQYPESQEENIKLHYRSVPMCWLTAEVAVVAIDLSTLQELWLAGCRTLVCSLKPAFIRVGAGKRLKWGGVFARWSLLSKRLHAEEKWRVKWTRVETSSYWWIIDLQHTSLISGWCCFTAAVSGGLWKYCKVTITRTDKLKV